MREMKDSGVEWIGDVPVTWDLVQTKTVVSCKNEKSDYNGATYIGLEHIESGSGKLLTEGKQVDLVVDSTVSSFSASDVLFGKLRPYLAKVAKPDFSGQCSTEILVLSPSSQIYRNYLFWYMINPAFIEAVNSSTYGAKMPRANWSFIGSCIMPLPPLQIQKGISDFLDKKCAQVDALMANVQTQIEKLKAYKQSLITEVVTKGLDPSVPMKDSEVEWIGCYPNSWRLSHIGKVAEMGAGGTPSRNNPEYWDNGSIPWMSSGEINYEYVYDTSEKITELGMKNSNAKLLPINTVMLGLIGQGRTKGLSAILKIECTCNQNLAYLIANPTFLHYEYLFYCFKAMYSYIRGVVGESQAGIYQGFLKMQYIPLPSTSEQIMISNYLNEKCSQIDHLIAIKQAKIEKLEQYKRSLIYEYVTGKKEVR